MAVLQILLALAYPPLVYFGLTIMSPRQVAFCVAATLGLRLFIVSPARFAAYTRIFWFPVVAMSVIAASTAASNNAFTLLLTPVVINLGLLCVFGLSFLQEETTVERLAMIQVPDLPEPELAYCRRVTGAWCAFFSLNGSVALGLAFHGDMELWTIYTGLIGYVLMGTLFAAEYVYRQWRFRRYVGSALDPIMKWFFLPFDSVAALSDAAAPEEAQPPAAQLDPEELGESRGPGFLHQDLCVPDDLSVWPGHFPEYAIVPGVLQIRWVLSLVHRLTEREGSIEAIEVLKFKRPLLPGQKFRLEVQVNERDPSRFRFRLIDGESVFSSGVLCLRGADTL